MKKKNFFIIDNNTFEHGLKPRDIAIYCFLCRSVNQQTGVAFPSRKEIGRRCGIRKEETVDRALKVLVEKGLIEKHSQHTENGTYGSNVYKIIDLSQ